MENVHADILAFSSHVTNPQNPKLICEKFCEIVTPNFVRNRQTKDYLMLAPSTDLVAPTTNHQSCLNIDVRYDTCYALRESVLGVLRAGDDAIFRSQMIIAHSSRRDVSFRVLLPP